MKKILISAASIAVLTTGVAAHANHNYVGLGLGWTAVNAPGKQSTTPGAVTASASKTIKDTSAFSGALILGRSFSDSPSGIFVEARIGKDSSNAKSDYAVKVSRSTGTQKTSLKRKFFSSLGVGYSQEILPELNVYGKVSVVLSKFQIQTTATGSYSVGRPINFQGTGQKQRTLLGFAPTFGFAKSFSGDFSLTLDYTAEFYKKITANGTYNQINPGDKISAKAKPVYHTVMLGITKKI